MIDNSVREKILALMAREVVPAVGCTEPMAVALCVACATEILGREPERITLNVADLLDDLIRQADELVGKPVALMTKDDKVKAIRYLSNSGALLITKSGDKIAKHFGISKYTLYSYLDNSKTGGETT